MTDRHILGGQRRRPIRAVCILPLLLSLVWPLVLALSPVNSHQVRVCLKYFASRPPQITTYLVIYCLGGIQAAFVRGSRCRLPASAPAGLMQSRR